MLDYPMEPNPLQLQRKRWPWIAGVAVIGVALAGWWWLGTSRNQEAKGATRASTTLVVSCAPTVR